MTDSMSIYDDPELSPSNITFNKKGDRFEGTMVRAEAIKTQFGKVAKFWFYDANSASERTMLAGAVNLWQQLSDLRPEPGDLVTILCTNAPDRGAKSFEVTVQRQMGDLKDEPF